MFTECFHYSALFIILVCFENFRINLKPRKIENLIAKRFLLDLILINKSLIDCHYARLSASQGEEKKNTVEFLWKVLRILKIDF